jgi:integrase
MTCQSPDNELVNASMAKRSSSTFGRVWRYAGTRGVVWRIRYRDPTGKRILETLGKEPEWTRPRAEKELRRRLVDVERDGYRAPEKLTLTEFAERWQTEYLPGRGLKLTTLDNYRQTLNRHLLPSLGHHTLHHLEQHPELIDHYITQKIQSGLAPKTVTNQILVLQVMLKRAVRWRLIRHNPVNDCDRPRLRQPEMNVLTETEIARLWTAYTHLEHAAAENTPIDTANQAWWRLARTITFVALGTAMRRGELLALQWKDVQLLEGHLTVRQALVKGRITTPKSAAGRRLIELGPRTKQLLADHYATTAYDGDDDYVFAHPSKGTPTDPSRLAREHLRPALHTAGITKPFRPFHDLRHTALTHEAAAGNPLTYIQMKAGHSQTQTTERYIHAAQVQFLGAAARAEARMFQNARS